MRVRTKRFTGTVEVEDAKVEFERATAKEARELRLAHTVLVGPEGMQRPELDDSAYAVALFKKQVKAWDGIDDEDGNLLECNNQNKELVCVNDPEFATEVIGAINKKIAAREGLAEKNSLSGADGI